MKFSILTTSTIVIASTSVFAGPVAWGSCQTACNVGYGVCCASAGGVGALFCGLGVPAALVGCSAVQGACMTACTPLLLAPIP